jgi:hypothetical protein
MVDVHDMVQVLHGFDVHGMVHGTFVASFWLDPENIGSC